MQRPSPLVVPFCSEPESEVQSQTTDTVIHPNTDTVCGNRNYQPHSPASTVDSRRSSTYSDSSTLIDVPLRFNSLKDLYDNQTQTQPKPKGSKFKLRWPKYRPSFTSALKTAITIGEATNLPYLKGVAGIILVIYNAVQVSFNSQSASAPLPSSLLLIYNAYVLDRLPSPTKSPAWICST